MLATRLPDRMFLPAMMAVAALFSSAAPSQTVLAGGFAEVDSWGYQLQNIQPAAMASDGFDVLVVDYSRDGSDATALTADDLAKLRKRAGHPDRIILAYLSIGEAEDYRYYWRDEWIARAAGQVGPVARPKSFQGAPDGKAAVSPMPSAPLATLTAAAPTWLANENPEWPGNFLVRYWEKDWQNIIFGSHEAYLDKILAAGFDGIYLDKIDANDDWQATRPTAEQEIKDFVKALAAYARAKRTGFLIVPQNAEELLVDPSYVSAIDGIAKEDLLYGGRDRGDGVPNSEAEIAGSTALLARVKAAAKGVLVVEYIEEPEKVAAARQRIESLGFVPFFAKRALEQPPSNQPR